MNSQIQKLQQVVLSEPLDPVNWGVLADLYRENSLEKAAERCKGIIRCLETGHFVCPEESYLVMLIKQLLDNSTFYQRWLQRSPRPVYVWVQAEEKVLLDHVFWDSGMSSYSLFSFVTDRITPVLVPSSSKIPYFRWDHVAHEILVETGGVHKDHQTIILRPHPQQLHRFLPHYHSSIVWD